MKHLLQDLCVVVSDVHGEVELNIVRIVDDRGMNADRSSRFNILLFDNRKCAINIFLGALGDPLGSARGFTYAPQRLQA